MPSFYTLDYLSIVGGLFYLLTDYPYTLPQPRPTLFGEMLHNVSYHDYLALRVRAGGDTRTWNSYFVNIQTEGGYSNDLWQHRLYFKRSDGGWEDVYVRA